MVRNFDDDLRRDLEDPECAAYFANAQVESAKELLKCGVIQKLSIGTMVSKTTYSEWRANNG